MNRWKFLSCLVPVLFMAFLSGCGLLLGSKTGGTFVGSALDRAANVAGEKVGQKVGESVGTAMAGYAEMSLRGLSPALMQLYVSSIFSSVFYAGGYYFDYTNTYQSGDWTKWKATGMDEGDEFQKAFLKITDDGKEWWQIITSSVREGKREEVILEALFSAPDETGIRKLLRLRTLFPGDKEPAEMLVQENTAAWYHDPIKITKESLEAATKGIESVNTPAGTFTAQHVVYRDAYGIGEWWLTDKIPGGLVKYQVTSSSSQEGQTEQYTVELVGYGQNASTRLGSY
ncbi:MAG: hypothetical protein ACUVWN_14155 [bacterium]